MTEPLDDLPEGWLWTHVGDVVLDAQAGFSSGKKDVPGGLPHLRMNNITSECTLDIKEVRTVPPQLAKPRHYLRPKDVLVCHTNSAKLVGKTAIYDLNDRERAFSNHLTRLRVKPDVIDPRWLWRELSRLWRDRYFETRCKRWVNQATIERDVLLAAPVALPPLAEQQRLVEKIERLLEQSRTARQALDRIPPLLRRFRQAILAKAFRGELTERDPSDEPASVLLERIREGRRRTWEEGLRAKGKDPRRARFVQPVGPDTIDLPELPEGWMWTTVGEVIGLLQYGSSLKASSSKSTGIPIIGMRNLKNGKIKLHEPKYVDETDEDTARYLLEPDDILINRTNSPELVGKAARWNIEGRFIFASYLIRLRADARVVAPQYLAHLMSSQTTRDHIARVRHQVAGQSNINSRDIRSIPVPLAPIAEQQQIVDRISTLFSHASAIEERVQIAQAQAARLDQSMLARAFQGRM
ncbi:MAG: restriction endonuclease subunit S [Chloroflexi bacterium]|nr:restriction endonuclease subunit S [Chloroflexota bacterium]